ncbi:hypothetical protein C9975_03060 [Thalassospira xiamenensis]|nr:hypothetical protein C9975_03060 [Thalassospira xiamenensis]
MAEEIKNLGSGFDEYDKVIYDPEGIGTAWLILKDKNQNPFERMDITFRSDGMFRVSIEDYVENILYVTKPYSTREQAFRAFGRIIDQAEAGKKTDKT